MSELKTHLYPVSEGEIVTDDGFLLTDNHSVKDLLRHVVAEVGPEDMLYFATEVYQEARHD